MARSSEELARIKALLDPNRAFEGYIAALYKGIAIGEVQRAELKKAFFGSIHWLMEMQLQVIANLPDDEAVIAQQSVYDAVQAFAASLPDNGQGGMTEEPVVTSRPH